MLWNSLNQELFLSDDKGVVLVWSVFRDALVMEQELSTGACMGLSLHIQDDVQVRGGGGGVACVAVPRSGPFRFPPPPFPRTHSVVCATVLAVLASCLQASLTHSDTVR
jgi:hypothetical protein